MGIYIYANPEMANSTLSFIVGFLFILFGLSSLFSFIKRGNIILFNNNLVYGVLLMLVGLFAMFMGNVLNVLLGIYVGLLGIQRINYAIFLKKFNESSWLLTLVIGVLYIAVGVITVFTDSDALIKVSAICLISLGLLNFLHVSLLRKRSRYFIA
jgi:uncharacterized membrane protein HdeD (DUF308 family)